MFECFQICTVLYAIFVLVFKLSSQLSPFWTKNFCRKSYMQQLKEGKRLREDLLYYVKEL